MTPDTLTLFGVGGSGKAVFIAPIGCADDLRVTIQDTNIVSVTPMSVNSVITQVFTITGLKVGSTIVKIDYAGTTPLCQESGSRFLTVNVIEPPAIIQQPASQTVTTGADVTFKVIATGGLLRYQWALNGVHIDGATGSVLTITNVQPTNAGDYSVTVYNPAGAVNSAIANLRVTNIVLLPFSDDFAGPNNVIGGTNGVGRGFNVGATREQGEPLHAGKPGANSVWLTWRPPVTGVVTLSTLGSGFDTLLGVYTGTTVSNLTEVASDNDSAGFLTSELKFFAVAGADYHIVVDGFHGQQGGIVFSWDLVPSQNPLTQIITQPTDQSAPTDNSVSLVVGFESPEPVQVQWFRDGVLVRDVSASGFDSLDFGKLNRQDVGNYFCRIVPTNAPTDILRRVFSRLVRVQIHVRGDGAVVHNIFTRDKFFEAADAASSPAGQALQKSNGRRHAGGPATGYTGTQIFSTFGSTKDPGEPNHCGVPGGASEWYSYVPPTNGLLRITTDGSDFDTVLAVYVIPPGQPVTYENLQSVSCDNDSGVNGRTSAVNFPATPDQIYYLAVDGVNGERGTAQLNYELDVPPVITQQPSSRTVSAGGNVTLNAAATGSPAPVYQWRLNGFDLAGATNASLTLTNFQSANEGSYTVVASNSTGTVTSAPAWVFLNSPMRLGLEGVNNGGQFQMSLIGLAGTNYVLQASIDLTTWLPVATNNSPTGIWNFTDPDSSNFSYRFYRAIQGQ